MACVSVIKVRVVSTSDILGRAYIRHTVGIGKV